MNKSSNSTPEQVVPMSTKVFNLIFDAYVFIWWVILCNPLSMLVIHGIKPKLASALAHDRLFCGDNTLKLYTKLAMKWPFRWSKWWLAPENVKALDAPRQVEYFLKVNRSQEVLDMLSSRAFVILVDDHRDKMKQIIKSMQLPNILFAEVLISPLAEELPAYIKRIGTLPKEQQQILMEQAVSDSYLAISTPATEMFLAYIERCGLSKALNEKLQYESIGASFKYAAMRALKCYDQRMTVRQYHNLDTETAERDWMLYLKEEGKLYVNPSMEMSLAQYRIFHKLGLTLKEDAILRFFKKIDSEGMKLEIMKSEPNHGIANNEIWETVCKDRFLRKLYNDVLTPEEREQNRIKGMECIG